MANRYLIVQLADIGDLILSTPALAALREAQPDAHIALLTTSHAAPVLKGANLVDEIVTFGQGQAERSWAFLKPNNLQQILALRDGQYDAVIFFHHFTLKLGTAKYAFIAYSTRAKQRIGLDNGNGWFLNERLPDEGFGAKHQAQYWLDLIGLIGASSSPRPAQIGRETFDISLSERKTVVIHAGSGGYSLARRWDAGKFAVLADRLQQDLNAQIVLVGGKGDDSAAVKGLMKSTPIDLTGETSLPQLAEVIASTDLFIGADSGVMHMAAATGTPMIAIFGPSNPDAWSPWNPGGKTIILRSAPECSPCSYVGHGVGLRDGCPARTCMRMVSVEQVYGAAKRILMNDPVGEGLRPSNNTRRILPKRIRILDLPVDGITYDQWLEMIGEWITTAPLPASKEGEEYRRFPRHICTINPEFMMIARKDVNFRNILNRADLCVPDGVGLLWAARRIGKPLPERVTGSDGVPKIAERAAEKGWRLFFLGAAPGVADQAADVLRVQYPGLQIVGTYSGSPSPAEEDALVKMVNDSHADILFVAYGAPEQDKWIARNLPRLDVKMAMGVGGAFDFIAGVVPRAPMWMRRLGLEWLYRLYLQPWRIRRMMRLPRFVLRVLVERRSTN